MPPAAPLGLVIGDELMAAAHSAVADVPRWEALAAV